MASVYPDSYDDLSNPTSSDSLAAVPHATQHANINDAMEAVQAELGLDPAGASSTVKARIDVIEANGWVTSARIADGTIATADLADSSVTTAKILDGTILSTDLSATATAAPWGGSVLLPTPVTPHPCEALLKQAVWWIDAQHASSTGAAAVNLGWGGAGLDAAQATAANQPKKLDYAGTPYVYLPGVASNYLSVPDEAALNPSSLDVIVCAAADDWTPSGYQTIVGKRAATAIDFGYALQLQTGSTGLIELVVGTSSTTVESKASTVAPTVADGAAMWIRATKNAATGDTTFFTSTGPSDSVPTSWTQLGAVVPGTAAAVYNDTNILLIGNYATGSTLFAGKFYRAIIKNGIDGTPVLDIDTSVITSGSATSFTALTGQTVTINRSTSGRKAVAVVAPVWLFGTDDYLEVPDNDLLDFGATDSFTVVAAHRSWATFGTNDVLLAKKANTTATTLGWTLTAGSTTAAQGQGQIGDGTNGTTAVSGSRTTGAISLVAAVRSIAGDTLTTYLNGVAGTAVTDASTGTLANTEVMRVGRLSGAGTEYLDGEGHFFGVFRRALTAAEVTVLSDYLRGRAA